MNYLQVFKKYWYLVVLIVICGTLLSFVLSLLQTPKYVSSVNLLVIQQQGNRLDAYSASRSAEIISKVLSKMVYTSSFFEHVKDTNFNLDNNFSEDPQKRQEEWEKMVKTNASGDGSLQIDVYHKDRAMAENYALANAYVLVNNGQDYHGGDNTVEIKMVDKPFTSTKIASPNLGQNVALGAIAGLFVSLSLGLFLGFRDEENGKGSGNGKKSETITVDEEHLRETVVPDKRPLVPVSDLAFDNKVNEDLSGDIFGNAKEEPEIKSAPLQEIKQEKKVEKEVLQEEKKTISIPSPFIRNESDNRKKKLVREDKKSIFEVKKESAEKLPSIFDDVKKKESGIRNLESGEKNKGEISNDGGVKNALKQEDSKGVVEPHLPVLENKKKGPLPSDLKRNLKKDFYHPESVDAWIKKGKFEPKDAA